MTRRRWPLQEKRRIVGETMRAGASIAQVARVNGVNANQVHRWRRLAERGLLVEKAEQTRLLPVRIIPDSTGPSVPVVRLSAGPLIAAQSHADGQGTQGIIQIEVERGRLRIEGVADLTTVRVALELLLG